MFNGSNAHTNPSRGSDPTNNANGTIKGSSAAPARSYGNDPTNNANGTVKSSSAASSKSGIVSKSGNVALLSSGSILNQRVNNGNSVKGFINKAIDIIGGFENPKGPWLSTHYDTNHWRIGFSSDTITNPDGTVREVKKGDKITVNQAKADLGRRIAKMDKHYETAYGSKWTGLTDGAKVAILSATYNFGSLERKDKNAKTNAVIDGIKAGNPKQISNALKGLARGVNRERRNKEAQIALNDGNYSGSQLTDNTPNKTPITSAITENDFAPITGKIIKFGLGVIGGNSIVSDGIVSIGGNALKNFTGIDIGKSANQDIASSDPVIKGLGKMFDFGNLVTDKLSPISSIGEIAKTFANPITNTQNALNEITNKMFTGTSVGSTGNTSNLPTTSNHGSDPTNNPDGTVKGKDNSGVDAGKLSSILPAWGLIAVGFIVVILGIGLVVNSQIKSANIGS